MSRYTAPAGKGGGHGTIFKTQEGHSDLEHDRDVSLAQRAFTKLDKQRRAVFASMKQQGRAEPSSTERKTLDVRKFARDLCRQLGRGPYKRLSLRQRVGLLNILGIDLPPLGPAAPAQVLPLKPPRRTLCDGCDMPSCSDCGASVL